MDETQRPGEPTRRQLESQASHATDSSSRTQTERFAPGIVIAGRYRIVSRLGHGGMGEVYRADDQRLGTSVALKFLPVSKSLDPVWRDRLLREVKVAREVTHPNVCRVFDLAEHDGQFFLSMEYIDGEDLSSLLRRIGRFPEDKALEIARQICLGLAAAHEEGVLHRDLKPANVMLDGRGRIKITDFGLAALTEKLEGPEARSGTLAYMAPEQKAGREVTRKSDIYSLGLVLHEVFTGKMYDPTNPSGTLAGKSSAATHAAQGSRAASSGYVLDPVISRILARCLKEDPQERPNSAFAVAAALPGGDPLQAALAAGETPSPEMVAEAGGSSAFSRRLLTASLVLVFVFSAISFVLWENMGIARVCVLAKSPEALTELSQQAIKELGYSTSAADSAGWLRSLGGPSEHYRYSTGWDEFRRRMKAEHPATWMFVYRQSSSPLAPVLNDFETFDEKTPPPSEGDILVKLSGSGHLMAFKVSTGNFQQATPSPSTAPAVIAPIEIDKLARLTDLALERMSPSPPIYQSGQHVNERLAWVGKYPVPNDLPVRVEAGRLDGRLIYLVVIPPWELPKAQQKAIGYRPAEPPPKTGINVFFEGLLGAVSAMGIVLIVGMFLVCAYLALHQVRSGIADIRGGTRLAVLVFAIATGSWLLATHFPRNLSQSAEHLISGLGVPAVLALMTFAAYIALEPFVRSHWPEKLIAWSRMIDGRLRDPLVAGECLIGLAAAAICRVVAIAPFWAQRNPIISSADSTFESFPHALAGFAWGTVVSVCLSLLIIFTLAAVRRWLGKTWLSLVVSFPVAFIFVNYGYGTSPTWLGLAGFLLPVLVMMAVVVRFGLLALVVCYSAYSAAGFIPLTLSSDAYWWPSAAILGSALLLLAVFAWRQAMPRVRSSDGSVAV